MGISLFAFLYRMPLFFRLIAWCLTSLPAVEERCRNAVSSGGPYWSSDKANSAVIAVLFWYGSTVVSRVTEQALSTEGRLLID